MAGVPGKGGPKPRTLTRRETEAALHKLTRKSVAVLEDALEKNDVDVAKYIINHVIGAPKQKQEVTGAYGGKLILHVVYDDPLPQ